MARILVADDDAAMRDFLELSLEAKGHVVTLVEDGGEALELVRGKRFDLVLTDIVMPVMDGISLALNVRAEQPETPVILMSGYSDEQQRAVNLNSLIGAVLAKPFTASQLGDLIDDCLGSD